MQDNVSFMEYKFQVPQTIHNYQLDITNKQGWEKLKSEFAKNAQVKDPRLIDLLVVKVCMQYCKLSYSTSKYHHNSTKELEYK